MIDEDQPSGDELRQALSVLRDNNSFEVFVQEIQRLREQERVAMQEQLDSRVIHRRQGGVSAYDKVLETIQFGERVTHERRQSQRKRF